MLKIMRCSACLIFRQRLIPSTTTCWSSAWRGLMVLVRLRLLDWLHSYLLDRRQSVFYDGVSSSVRRLVWGSRRAQYWDLCNSLFIRQTLASWRLVLACHLIFSPTTRNSTRGATLHLMDCRSEGWRLAFNGSQCGCGLTDFVLIPRRRSFFGARLVDDALLFKPH